LNADLNYELTGKEVDRLKRLEKVLDGDEKFDVVYALSQKATSRELDSLCKAMVYYYATKGRALPMLVAFITREVAISGAH